MQLTFGPFFTCFIITLFLAVYLYIITHHTSVRHPPTPPLTPSAKPFPFPTPLVLSVLSGSAKDGRIYDRKYC